MKECTGFPPDEPFIPTEFGRIIQTRRKLLSYSKKEERAKPKVGSLIRSRGQGTEVWGAGVLQQSV